MTLAALLIAVAAVAGGGAFAVVRAVGLWRQFRAFARALGGEMDAFAARVDVLGAHEPPQTDRLAEGLERLQRSVAQLSLLLNALGRVRAQWSGLLAVYPRK